jgi:hypothetical protein
MKFKPGDLVVHARGTVHPFDKLQGVVVRDDLFTDDQYEFPCYRVFWYTLSSYQNLQESCLKSLDNSLTA